MPDGSCAPTLQQVRKLLRTKLASGKSLIDFTTYNGTAMWWFVDAEFYYSLDAVLNGHSSRRPFLIRPSNVYSRMEFLVPVPESILIRALLGLLGTKKPPRINKQTPKILFSAQDWQWRLVKDDETGCMRKSDAFFDSILKKLLDKCEFVGVDPLTLLHPALLRAQVQKWKILIDKLQHWDVPHRPFELYWSTEALKAEKNAWKHFESVWSNVRDDPALRAICNEIGPGDWIQNRLEYSFLVAFPRAARYVQVAKRMIEREKPNLILLLNEYGLFERATVVAAKQLRVPTLAIQHGVIHLGHKGYVYAKDEISPTGNAESPYCPIPDKTAVYGPFHRQLLTKLSAYPRSHVIVTGQPRYDRLHHIRRLYPREVFLRKHKIDPNHKIILWTTQCHGLTMQENRCNFKTVLQTMQTLKNVALIIKQHPGEAKNYTTMIKNYLVEYGAYAVVTPGNSDVYEQLFACDLLIAKNSTTIIESVALGKPVVVLNLMRDVPSVGLDFAEEGVAVQVSRGESLGPTIEKLLVDDSQLARKRKAFVKEYLYKLDGRATDRVVGLVWEMMRHD